MPSAASIRRHAASRRQPAPMRPSPPAGPPLRLRPKRAGAQRGCAISPGTSRPPPRHSPPPTASRPTIRGLPPPTGAHARSSSSATRPRPRCSQRSPRSTQPPTTVGSRARLGRVSDASPPADLRAPPPQFPSDLAGPYADGARVLVALGLRAFAREELDALRARGGADVRLVVAYAAARAPDAAARLAVALGPHGALERYAYPLAYWETVRREAAQAGVDPLLVLALMRQESFFDPAAASPADAQGLMQLLPRTAREVAAAAGRAPPSLAALHEPATAIALGTLHLRGLL